MRLTALIAVMLGVFVLLPGAILVLHDPPPSHSTAVEPSPWDRADAMAAKLRREGYTGVVCQPNADGSGGCQGTKEDDTVVLVLYASDEPTQ